jgi:hypothetical protein
MGAHEAAAIEDDPYGLAALGLVLAGDEAAAARGRGPADVAQIVAFSVLAQAFEVAAQTAQAGLAELEVDLAAAGKKDLLLLAGAEGRIDTHCLNERGAGPVLGQTQAGAVAEIKPAGGPVAALLGLDTVTEAGGNAWEGDETVRGGVGDKGGGKVVDQPAIDDQLTVVLDGELDFGFRVEGWGVGPGAGSGEIAGGRETEGVKNGKHKD